MQISTTLFCQCSHASPAAVASLNTGLGPFNKAAYFDLHLIKGVKSLIVLLVMMQHLLTGNLDVSLLKVARPRDV